MIRGQYISHILSLLRKIHKIKITGDLKRGNIPPFFHRILLYHKPNNVCVRGSKSQFYLSTIYDIRVLAIEMNSKKI